MVIVPPHQKNSALLAFKIQHGETVAIFKERELDRLGRTSHANQTNDIHRDRGRHVRCP